MAAAPEISAEGITIYIEGDAYTILPEDMELWEVELLEDVCDAAIEEIDFNRAKAIRILVYLVRRRRDPEFTMDDARHVKLSTLGAPDPEADTTEDDDAEAKARVEADAAKDAIPAAKPKPKRRPTRAAASS